MDWRRSPVTSFARFFGFSTFEYFEYSGSGCVQEEIRFMINPECIVSRLFTAVMDDNEAVLISGAQRYSSYEGYARTFTYKGDHTDIQELDEKGHLKSYIVAIDALNFGLNPWSRITQYTKKNIVRELNKAYIGFHAFQILGRDEKMPVISTGNLGCGVFGGYHDVKAVIQLMAAAQTGNKLLYFTFEENGLKDSLEELHGLLKEKRVTVGSLYRTLMEISSQTLPKQEEKEEEKEDSESSEDPETRQPQLFNLLIEHYRNVKQKSRSTSPSKKK